jgi:hypothetical protein
MSLAKKLISHPLGNYNHSIINRKIESVKILTEMRKTPYEKTHVIFYGV